MGGLVAAEVRKLFTTRVWLWLLLGSMALTALLTGLAIAFADDPDNPTPLLSTPEGQQTLFSVGQSATTLVSVLAAIGLTGEFRHRTISATFLATPRRERVIAAKLATYTLVGAVYGVAAILANLAVALPGLAARDVDVSLLDHGIPATLAGVVAAVAIYGLVGVGLGALLRDQVATVTALLVYLFVVETVLTRIPVLEAWTRYLPGSATAALTQVSQTGYHYLAPWTGGLVLTAYGLLLAVAGTLTTMRRDVT